MNYLFQNLFQISTLNLRPTDPFLLGLFLLLAFLLQSFIALHPPFIEFWRQEASDDITILHIEDESRVWKQTHFCHVFGLLTGAREALQNKPCRSVRKIKRWVTLSNIWLFIYFLFKHTYWTAVTDEKWNYWAHTCTLLLLTVNNMNQFLHYIGDVFGEIIKQLWPYLIYSLEWFFVPPGG